MNRSAYAILAMAGLVAISPTVDAKEVYTWTDENGVVHYVDTPPDHPDARSVEAPEAYRPGSVTHEPVFPDPPPAGDPAQAGSSDAEGESAAEQLSAADARRQELEQRRQERLAQQAEYAAICNRARQQLAEVEPNRRVFYENEDGETVRMDDEERVALVEENKRLIDQYCND
ncbi:DUF4124 domain-containing protein [Elongatibacter sediminis]|uniref:DUF4124 domain-containing protein n=1 Tax=Elongatibacter sediminis TaxID=3119006 RepID=A0AAW9RJL6_9GAMM